MKWNNGIWLLWVTIILGSILVWKGTKDRQSLDHEKQSCTNVDTLQKTLFFAKETLLNQVLFSGKDMMKLTKFINDSIRVKNRPILVYRYSSTMCEACVNKDLNILLEYLPKIGKENILILPAFKSDRDSRIKMQSSLCRFNYHNIEEKKVSIPVDVEQISHRFLAVLNSCNQIDYIYYPNKNFNSMTYTYLEYLLNEINK